MHSHARIKPVWIGLILVALMGCSDASPIAPSPEPDPLPLVAFTYTGERSGSFQISGSVSLTPDGGPRYGTWAAALKVPGSDLSITAARAHAEPLADVFLIALHNISVPGTYAMDRQCDHHTPSSCALGLFAFSYDWSSSERPPEAQYIIGTGTITVTEISASRLRGSFQVEGLRQPRGTIRLANGSFDIPVLQANGIRQNALPLWDVLERQRVR